MPAENPVLATAAIQQVASLANPSAIAPAIIAPGVSTAILSAPGVATRSAQSVPVILPAGTLLNGQIQPSQAQIVVPGDRFYVLATSSNIAVTPYRAGAAGTQNTFGIGQGRNVQDGFENLIVANYSTNPVVALIWVGFDDFINNQLIIATNAYQAVVNPTYPTANASTQINIPDLTGTVFFDINGAKWGAIQRIAILIFNLASGSYLLQKSGAATGLGPAVASIPPAPLPLQLPFSGNYTINNGGATINMIVSEIYYAIPMK